MFKLRTPTGIVKLRFGRPSDMPISGDWDGDGTTEIGIWRPAEGTFWPRMADGSTAPVWLGDADDLPVTGDWDGNGTTDVGTWDPATAEWKKRQATSATASRSTTSSTVFGSPR